MGISVVTPPATEPISLDEVKAQCRITTDTEDGSLAGYILAARQFAEGYTRRRFLTQTLDCTFDSIDEYLSWPSVCDRRGYRRYRIDLPISPIQSVVSVSYVDFYGTTQVLAEDQYLSKLDQVDAYIEPAYRVVWPSVRFQSSAITVRVVAGWTIDQFPEDLRLKLLMLVSAYYDNRGILPSDLQSALQTEFSEFRFVRIPK